MFRGESPANNLGLGFGARDPEKGKVGEMRLIRATISGFCN